MMCEEEDVRKYINYIAIIKFKEFEITVGGILMQCRYKIFNEGLDKIFAQDFDFPDYEDMKHACVAIGGDHAKWAFTMSLTMCA